MYYQRVLQNMKKTFPNNIAEKWNNLISSNNINVPWHGNICFSLVRLYFCLIKLLMMTSSTVDVPYSYTLMFYYIFSFGHIFYIYRVLCFYTSNLNHSYLKNRQLISIFYYWTSFFFFFVYVKRKKYIKLNVLNSNMFSVYF